MSVESLCVHTITIQRNSAVSDGRGGTPDNWVTKHKDIAARIRPVGAREQAQWGGTPALLTHIVYVADASLEILEKDRILYGTRSFDVLGVRDIDELGRFLTIDAREIR